MSGCACVYPTEADGPEFSNIRYRKARKEHKCCECEKVIEKGERYEIIAGKWDGDVSTFKTCLDCAAIRDELFCHGHTFEYLYHDLNEHIRDTDGQIAPSCLVKLPRRARNIICDMIDRYWEKDDERRKKNA